MSDKKHKGLRPGWRQVKFGDVVRQCKERSDPDTSGLERYIAGDHMDTDDLRLRRWGEIGSGYLGPAFHMRFRPGQVLYGSRRTYLRKVAVADFEGICANTTFVLEATNPNELLPEFLPFLMQTEAFNAFSVRNSKGSVNPFINFSDLARFEFALPPSEEQHRFVLLLQAIEENFVALDEACASTSALQWSRLDAALNAVSEDYLHPVEELVKTAPRNGLSPKVNAENRGFPTLSIGSVRDGLVVTEGNIKYAEVTSEQAHAFALKPNDVLVVRGNGNKRLTGKCGVVVNAPTGCFYPDLLIRLQFNEKVIRPEFAAMQWNSPSVHKLLISRAKSTNGIWKINGGDIRQHTLKVPPIEQQDALLEELGEIRQVRAEIENRKTKNRALKSLALSEITSGSGDGI